MFINRLVMNALVWAVLSGGAADSWLVGGPAVLMASWLSCHMLPPLRWSARGVLRFWGFFLLESWRGGVDVARRTFHRDLPLDPGIVRHRHRVSPPAARVSVANTVSLLPGTLSADLDDEWLHVHALDAGQEVRESLEYAEWRVAALFGLELERPEVDRGLGGTS